MTTGTRRWRLYDVLCGVCRLCKYVPGLTHDSHYQDLEREASNMLGKLEQAARSNSRRKVHIMEIPIKLILQILSTVLGREVKSTKEIQRTAVQLEKALADVEDLKRRVAVLEKGLELKARARKVLGQ